MTNIIMLKGSLCHSPQALGNTSTPWQPPPLYQRKAPDGCFGEDSADVWLWFVNCTQSVFGRISNISPDQDSEAQAEACEEDYFKMVVFELFLSRTICLVNLFPETGRKHHSKCMISAAYGLVI